MKKIIVVAALASAVALTGTVAQAKKPRAASKDFTAQSQAYTQWKAARAKYQLATLALRQKIAARMLALRAEWAQAKPDKAKIKGLYLEMIDLKAALAKKRVEIMPFSRFGRGFGRGFRQGGFGRGGYNCPGFGPGNGRGMRGHRGFMRGGPGYGRGMMGPGGYGRGMTGPGGYGRGMMGPGYGRGYSNDR